MILAPGKRSPHQACQGSEVEGGPSDEQLLERFLDDEGAGSERAFRELVARHGPMVLGVCRHVLQQNEDAEDAFQATFLALARKAGGIRDRRVLAGWLHEVAYRIAVRARVQANRRRTKESEGLAMIATVAPANHEEAAAWGELRPVLHDEIDRLPAKYRLPVILSYLEGKSNEEVARMLAWPVGTVKGRLSRARELLRSRLLRRGLALSAAFLVTALSRDEVFAEVLPEALLDRTVDGVMAYQAGLLPAPDVPLREKVLGIVPEPAGRWTPLRPGGRAALPLVALVALATASVSFAFAAITASGTPRKDSVGPVVRAVDNGKTGRACGRDD